MISRIKAIAIRLKITDKEALAYCREIRSVKGYRAPSYDAILSYLIQNENQMHPPAVVAESLHKNPPQKPRPPAKAQSEQNALSLGNMNPDLEKERPKSHQPVRKKKESKYVTCSQCSKRVPRKNMIQHLESHSRKAEARRKKRLERASKKRKAALSHPESAEKNIEPPKTNRLILISKRGKPLDGGGKCAECGSIAKRLWRYTKSNQGTVHICPKCKPKVFDRSFGTVDAMNVASTVVSSFETNRHRH